MLMQIDAWMSSFSLILLIENEKKILFFYPHLANDFPDAPSAGDTGTGTNYIYRNNEKNKIETNVSNKRVKKGELTNTPGT